MGVGSVQLEGRSLQLESGSVQLNGRSPQLNGRGAQLGSRSVQLEGRGLQLEGESVQLNGQGTQLGGRNVQLDGQGRELNTRSIQLGGKINRTGRKRLAISRQRLGYLETIRQLKRRQSRCHPSNRAYMAEQLEDVKVGVGSTVFDWLVEIIRHLCAGGGEEEDGVELLLK